MSSGERPKSVDHLVQLVADDDEAQKRMRRLTADLDEKSLLPRSINDLSEHDPFGILEVKDTYAAKADEVFEDCEMVFETLMERDKTIRKQALSHGVLTGPALSFSKFHTFQLIRRQLDDDIIFTFNRVDPEHEHKSFEIVHKSSGGTFIESFGAPKLPPQDDDPYAQLRLITMAQRYITEYSSLLDGSFAEQGQQSDAHLNRGLRINNFLKEQFILRLLTAPYWKNSEGHITRSDRYNTRKITERHWSMPRIGLVAAICATTIVAGVMSENEAAEEEAWYNSDISLPADSPAIGIGEAVSDVAAVQTADIGLAHHAPSINADYDDETIEGLRPFRLTRLAITDYEKSNDVTDHDLDTDECEDVPVNINSDQELRIANVPASVSKQLQFEISAGKLLICNISENPHASIKEDSINDIYVQIVNKKD